MRDMSSFVLAPVAAGKVFPVCGRSWNRKCSSPSFDVVARHRSFQFARRNGAPIGPQKIKPSGPLPEYSKRGQRGQGGC